MLLRRHLRLLIHLCLSGGRITAHVLIEIIHIMSRVVARREALIVYHHAVDLLRHIYLIIAWLTFFLISLTLFAIAVFVESRCGSSATD